MLDPTKQRRFAQLAFLAFLLAFIVILLGAYTRLNNAGLSCPDWPRCYGYFTPPSTSAEMTQAAKAFPLTPIDSARAWIEMRHRYLAGLEGLLILSLIGLSWRWRKELTPMTFALTQSLALILLGQILLGKLTVTALLKPAIVLGHLLFGFSLMSILWVLWLLTKKPWPSRIPSGFRFWSILGLLVLTLQITLGGWVSTHSAGLACIDFPYCNGHLLPTLQWKALHTDLITMHMLHRLGALLSFLYLGLLGIFMSLRTASRRYAYLLLGLLSLQILLGIINILWLRPLSIALPHHAVAALLLLTLLAILLNTRPSGNSR